MRATLRMILYFTAFAVGAACLAYLIRPELLDVAIAFIPTYEGTMVASGLAIIFMLCPLTILLRWWQVHRRAREISYSTESGRVSVNLIAVEEALTRALENEACVKKAHVRVYEDRVKRQVIIESAMVFWEVPNVTERNRQCQQILRRRFAELMPEQSAVQVNLNVHRITQRRDDAKRASSGKSDPQLTPVEPAAAAAPARPVVDAEAGSAPAPAEPPAGANPGSRRATTQLAPEPLANSTLGGDDGLYVGPSYPVESDEEEETSGVNYLGKALPATPSPPSRSADHGAGKR